MAKASEVPQLPARVAVLGGGQLARMTSEAAAALGGHVRILTSEPVTGPPARERVRARRAGREA